MKSLSFILLLVTSISFLGCSVKDTPQPETYPVSPNVSALHANMAGKKFNIELNKEGWYGLSSRMWLLQDGKNYVRYGINFQNHLEVNGEKLQIAFSLAAPPLPIADVNNINASYTYEAFKGMFVVGKNYAVASKNNIDGYRLKLEHVNLNDLSKSFNYWTFAVEPDTQAVWKVVKVTELPNQMLCVTYDIDCKLYDLNTRKYVGQFKGTIQPIFFYEPF
jgi:hypothetical protein